VGLLIFGAVTVFMLHKTRLDDLKGEFDLFTTSEKLKPKDVGFKRCKPGEQVGEVRRPYFDVYIPREAIAYFERGSAKPNRLYSEAQLVASLQEGLSILLIGAPTEGKTRTLFELVRRIKGFYVVQPKRDRLPSDDAMQLLKGKEVVCLLDDLNTFAGATVDLLSFRRQLDAVASHAAFAGACRDGANWPTWIA
jgi:hypothetical protein